MRPSGICRRTLQQHPVHQSLISTPCCEFPSSTTGISFSDPAHEGASKGEIAYTTDNERELAWRRKKEKGERLLSDEEGEEQN
jgi:hypothetical protein